MSTLSAPSNEMRLQCVNQTFTTLPATKMNCISVIFRRPASFYLLALILVSAACSRSPQSKPNDAISGAVPEEGHQALAGEGYPTATTPKIAPLARGDAIKQNFEGQAASYMLARAGTPSGELSDTVQQLVSRTAELEDCQSTTGQDNTTFQVDIDDDGVAEGLSLYTLRSCGGGSNAIRILTVLRASEDRKWTPILETAISTDPGTRRRIITIGDGTITLAGSSESFGGTQPPETIEIPELQESMTPDLQ